MQTTLGGVLLAVGALGLTACAGASRTGGVDVASSDVDLSSLAPRAAYGIYALDDGCAEVAGPGVADPVPVASVFKLWVLDAVARAIERGTLAWDTPVAIRDELRSDPSGEVFGYPTGKQVSVTALAELMISISDNTATDHLIDTVGRDAVSAVIAELAPDGALRTLPLLSTADMARLKFVHRDLGASYVALDRAARAEAVPTLPERGPFPWPDDPDAVRRLDLFTPSFIDEIEWFASGTDLCRTFADLARLSRLDGLAPLDRILRANPGLPPTAAGAWTAVWFKGGSEPGVLTLAFRLVTEGVDRVVVIALSDPHAPLAPQPQGQQLIESIVASARRAPGAGGGT